MQCQQIFVPTQAVELNRPPAQGNGFDPYSQYISKGMMRTEPGSIQCPSRVVEEGERKNRGEERRGTSIRKAERKGERDWEGII